MHDVKAYNDYRQKRKANAEHIILGKRELSKYQQAKRDIEYKRDRIMRLHARINSVTRDAREVDVQTQPDPKGIEDMLINAADMQREYGSMIVKAEAICEYVERLINKVEGPKGEVLYKRFIVGMYIETIQHDMVYSRSQVYNLLDDGMAEVGRNVEIERHKTLDTIGR